MLRMCLEHAPSGFQNRFRRDINRVIKTMMIKFNVLNYTHHACSYSMMYINRLSARRASRRPGTPLERKMDAFGRPKSGGKGKLFSMISLSILIYLKRNGFNSHYYYTFDILINLMVYLAE
jgi:hypothetical protein